MTDDRAAHDAITRILQRNPDADLTWTARHILTALRGLGWRPTNIEPPPGWQKPPHPPAPPTADYLAARPRSKT